MKRVTIKDIALQLGVNPSTVSRALKDHPDISPALRTEIKELAARLHYRPNHMAVYLRQRSSKLIGLIVPEVTMFFYPSVIKGIQDVLHPQGYSLIMLPSNNSLEREIENVQICFENDVAGLLLAFGIETKDAGHLAGLDEIEVPIVLFDKVLEGLWYDAVVLEDARTSAKAVEHLINTGCRRITGIFGSPKLRMTQLRLEGFRQAMRTHGLPDDTFHFAENYTAAAACVRTMMAAPEPPDGLFAMTDEVIAGVLPAVLESGRRVPDDCSIMCISDGLMPYYLYPRVTFLRHDGYETGQLAARRLLTLIETSAHLQPGYHGESIMVTTHLVELATTKRN
jgi:DNA-binding LacI/PurR family transcriptional regulator